MRGRLKYFFSVGERGDCFLCPETLYCLSLVKHYRLAIQCDALPFPSISAGGLLPIAFLEGEQTPVGAPRLLSLVTKAAVSASESSGPSSSSSSSAWAEREPEAAGLQRREEERGEGGGRNGEVDVGADSAVLQSGLVLAIQEMLGAPIAFFKWSTEKEVKGEEGEGEDEDIGGGGMGEPREAARVIRQSVPFPFGVLFSWLTQRQDTAFAQKRGIIVARHAAASVSKRLPTLRSLLKREKDRLTTQLEKSSNVAGEALPPFPLLSPALIALFAYLSVLVSFAHDGTAPGSLKSCVKEILDSELSTFLQDTNERLQMWPPHSSFCRVIKDGVQLVNRPTTETATEQNLILRDQEQLRTRLLFGGAVAVLFAWSIISGSFPLKISFNSKPKEEAAEEKDGED